MPNNCYFTIKVNGEPKNIKKFMESFIFEDDVGDDTKKEYLARTFLENYKNKEEFFSEHKEDIERGDVLFWGLCAWSCYSCWIRGYPEQFEQCVAMEHLAKKLKLKISVDSEETGEGFEEHIEYNENGITCSECYIMPVYKCKECGAEMSEASSMPIGEIECCECEGEVELIKDRELERN